MRCKKTYCTYIDLHSFHGEDFGWRTLTGHVTVELMAALYTVILSTAEEKNYIEITFFCLGEKVVKEQVNE